MKAEKSIEFNRKKYVSFPAETCKSCWYYPALDSAFCNQVNCYISDRKDGISVSWKEKKIKGTK